MTPISHISRSRIGAARGAWLADDFVPATHGELGSDNRGATAIALFEDFQKIMPGAGVEGLKTPVVENKQIGAAEITQQARTASVAARQREVFEQPGDPLVEDRPVVAAGSLAV